MLIGKWYIIIVFFYLHSFETIVSIKRSNTQIFFYKSSSVLINSALHKMFNFYSVSDHMIVRH